MLTIQKQKPRMREFRGPEPGSVAILARTPGQRASDLVMQQNRKDQEHYEECQAQVRYMKLAELRGTWENATDRKIYTNTIKRKFDHAKNVQTQTLEGRRDRLRQLLESEQRSYVAEMESSQETVIERQARLRERARHLKEEKEVARQQVADKKYAQLWRDQCEELRSTLSRRAAFEIAADRQEQIRFKEDLEREKKEEETYFARLWQEEIDKKSLREDRDVSAKLERNREMLATLQQQKELVIAKREEERKLKEEETKLRLEMMELRKLEAEREHEEKIRKQRETREMLDTNVRMKLKRRAREIQEELDFDTTVLETLLEQSQAEADNEVRRKRELMEETKRYRNYLSQLKAEEASHEKELDRLLDAEVEKQWQKRVDQWHREREARRALLDDVVRARRQQIEAKLERNAARRAEAAQERESLLALIKTNQELDLAEIAARRQKLHRYHDDLAGQIEFNQKLRAEDRAEEARENVKMAEAEVEFRRRIAATMEANWVDPKAHPWRQMASTDAFLSG